MAGDLQFKVDSEWKNFSWQFDLRSDILPEIYWEKVAEEPFCDIPFNWKSLIWSLNRFLSPNKPTHYLLYHDGNMTYYFEIWVNTIDFKWVELYLVFLITWYYILTPRVSGNLLTICVAWQCPDVIQISFLNICSLIDGNVDQS